MRYSGSRLTHLLLLALMATVLTGCVTAARKTVGQALPTEVKMSPCPQATVRSLAVYLDTSAVDKVDSANHDRFEEGLKKALGARGTRVTMLAAAPSASSSRDTLVVTVADLERNRLMNRWKMTGTTLLEVDGTRTASTFSAVNRKTIESTDSLFVGLADEIVGCLVADPSS
jgi:hypothetical protein